MKILDFVIVFEHSENTTEMGVCVHQDVDYHSGESYNIILLPNGKNIYVYNYESCSIPNCLTKNFDYPFNYCVMKNMHSIVFGEFS